MMHLSKENKYSFPRYLSTKKSTSNEDQYCRILAAAGFHQYPNITGSIQMNKSLTHTIKYSV